MTTPKPKNNELALMEWQIGKQSAFDKDVTPTARLVGISDGSIIPKVESSIVEEQRGTLVPAYDVTLDKKSGEAKISGDVNFEQIGYFLDSVLGEATPSGTTKYTRAYAGPIGTKPVPRICTLIRGSSEGVYGLVGAVGNELTLKGETNKRLTFDCSMLGHSVAELALASPALADPVVNYAHANQMTMFLDNWSGTMGTTPITANAFSFELGINSGKALKSGLGSLNPIDIIQNKFDAGGNQLKLALEFEATQSKAWLDAIIGGPLKAQVKLVWTLDADHTITVEYAGFTPEAPELFPDADGVAQLDLVLNPLYHTTFANWLKISLVNKVATLP